MTFKKVKDMSDKTNDHLNDKMVLATRQIADIIYDSADSIDDEDKVDFVLNVVSMVSAFPVALVDPEDRETMTELVLSSVNDGIKSFVEYYDSIKKAN